MTNTVFALLVDPASEVAEYCDDKRCFCSTLATAPPHAQGLLGCLFTLVGPCNNNHKNKIVRYTQFNDSQQTQLPMIW